MLSPQLCSKDCKGSPNDAKQLDLVSDNATDNCAFRNGAALITTPCAIVTWACARGVCLRPMCVLARRHCSLRHLDRAGLKRFATPRRWSPHTHTHALPESIRLAQTYRNWPRPAARWNALARQVSLCNNCPTAKRNWTC